MTARVCLLLLIASHVWAANAIDVVVGRDECSDNCDNYYRAESDATSAVQSAVNALNKANGGSLTFQEGTYETSRQLDILTSNVVIRGAGMDATVLKLADSSPTFRYAGLIRITIQKVNPCKNFQVNDLTLDGNKDNQRSDDSSKYGRYGIFTEGCNSVSFDNVKIQNFQGYGFDPHGWKTGPVYGRDLTITNCIAQDNNWDGFTLDQTIGITVRNCISIHNGRHGFNIVTGSRNVILDQLETQDNGFYDSHGGKGCGVMIQNNQNYGTKTVTLTNSVLKGDRKAGICVNDVSDITAKSNEITSYDSSFCLYGVNSRKSTFSKNVCRTSKGAFATLKTCSDITLTSNTLQGL